MDNQERDSKKNRANFPGERLEAIVEASEEGILSADDAVIENLEENDSEELQTERVKLDRDTQPDLLSGISPAVPLKKIDNGEVRESSESDELFSKNTVDIQRNELSAPASIGEPILSFSHAGPCEKPIGAEKESGSRRTGKALDMKLGSDVSMSEEGWPGRQNTPTLRRETSEPPISADASESMEWNEQESKKAGSPPEMIPEQDQPEPPSKAIPKDKTLIFNQEDQTEESLYPFLIIIQGDEEGREIEIIEDEFTIGRGPDNDLVFPDIACSRRHAIIERQESNYLITDLGSGNGTLLNGRHIQRSILRDGDEIKIGNTILQFVQSKNTDTQPDNAGSFVVQEDTATHTLPPGMVGRFFSRLLSDPRRRQLILVGGGSILGLLCGLFIVKSMMDSRASNDSSKEQTQQEQVRNTKEELENQKAAVIEFVKQKRWEDADRSVKKALSIDPNDRHAREFQDYIKREFAAYQALEKAKAFIEQKAFDQAKQAIQEVGEGSEYYEDSTRLREELRNRLLNDSIDQGKSLMNEGQYELAIVKFDEVLATDSTREDAAVLKKQSEEEIAKQEKERMRTGQKKKLGLNKKTTEKPTQGLISGQALLLYKNGEIDKAIEKASAAGEKPKIVLLQQFKEAYEMGLDLTKNKAEMGKALKYLNQALILDKKISHNSGKYYASLIEKLANVYFHKGVDAQLGQRYTEAYQSYIMVLKYRPGDDKAIQRLQELEKIAKKLYEEAYVIKSTEPEAAINKLNIVVQIVPPDHVYYNKAKRLRASIQGAGETPPGDDSGF